MSKIVPKLNLNKDPQNVENANLVLAKNIRVSDSQSIERDIPLSCIFSYCEATNENDIVLNYKSNLIGKIVGINHKIYFFIKQYATYTNNDRIKIPDIDEYYTLKPTPFENNVDENRAALFAKGAIDTITKINYIILQYNEISKEFTKIDCAWTHSGGKIGGCVINNTTNEEILVISEYFEDDPLNENANISSEDVDNSRLVPLKFINLAEGKHSSTDDESTYTQLPLIPITNLNFVDYVNTPIPVGVYQFFIRYEVNDYLHSAWFPCTGELFTGDKKKDLTIQGSVIHLASTDVSSKSFKFSVEHIIDKNKTLYNKFQIGFILSHENAIVCREWKHFDIDTTNITFSYNEDDVKEGNIDDFLSPQFGIFNAKNVVYFKNRLYCSNYQVWNADKEVNINTLPEITIDNKTFDTTDDTHLYINGIEYKTNEDGFLQKDGGDTNIKSVLELIKTDSSETHVSVSTDEKTCKYKLEDGKVSGTISEPIRFSNGNLYINVDGVDSVIHSTNPLLKLVFYRNNTEKTDVVNYGDAIIDNYKTHKLYGNTLIDNTSNNTDTIYNHITDFNTVGFYSDGVLVSKIKRTYIKNFKINLKKVSEDKSGILRNAPYWVQATLGNIISHMIAYIVCGGNVGLITISQILAKDWIRKYIKGEIKITYKADISYDIVEETLYPKLKYPITRRYDVSTLNQTTLMPLCTYDFYIHYVNNKGFVTNGRYITTKTVNYGRHNTFHVPVISNAELPNGFDAYFISVYKHPTIACELTNIKVVKKNNKPGITADCLELDASLVKGFDDITIAISYTNNNMQVFKTKAKYYNSNTTTPLDYFGREGLVEWFPEQTEVTEDGINLLPAVKIYALFNYDADYIKDERNKRLIKITPYLKDENPTISPVQLNLPGYVCQAKKINDVVKRIDDNTEIRLYTDGSTVGDLQIAEDGTTKLDVTRFDKIATTNQEINNPVYLLSCFNLNYLSFVADSDIITKFFTPEGTVLSDEDETSTTVDSYKVVLNIVPSLQISTFLELTKTFKEYTRKQYAVINRDHIYKYDNTVIASKVDTDEEYRQILDFSPLDYYNIPTNRGKIIKMFAISNTLYAHCSQALFKFAANNQLSNNETNIGLEERDIFITGCQNVYDNIYGYGGLYKQSHSIVTFDLYIFYDKLVNRIYAYDMNNMQDISESFRELIRQFDPIDVLFGYDYANDRLFINLVGKEYDLDRNGCIQKEYRSNVCLSYNFTTKSIASIHDMDYNESFCSRINCYFIKYDTSKLLCYKTNETFEIADNIELSSTELRANVIPYSKDLYGFLKKESQIKLTPKLEDFEYPKSVIDVIINDSYESIKCLNSISWICNNILGYFDDNASNADKAREFFSGNQILIYSDQTQTPYYDITTDNIIDAARQKTAVVPANKPTYNAGIWTFNVFRDVQNELTTNDGYYIAPYDNRSLLYGKYFVIRFVFNSNNFRLENVILNTNDYVKI